MLHQHAAGAGAEQADGAGHVRQVVGNRRLAQERLGHSGGQALGDRFQLPVRAQGPGTGEDRHAPAAIEDRRGGFQVGVARVGSRLDEAHRRHHVAVLVGWRFGAAICCTSLGTITVATCRSPTATRRARSSTWSSCAGLTTVST